MRKQRGYGGSYQHKHIIHAIASMCVCECLNFMNYLNISHVFNMLIAWGGSENYEELTNFNERWGVASAYLDQGC